MKQKKLLGIPYDNILCLSADTVLVMIAVWVIISVFFENLTIDSMVTRLGLASACIANLFSNKKIKIPLLIIAFILIIVATFIYSHKANNI